MAAICIINEHHYVTKVIKFYVLPKQTEVGFLKTNYGYQIVKYVKNNNTARHVSTF